MNELARFGGLFDQEFLGIKLSALALAFFILFATFTLKNVIVRWIVGRLTATAKRTENPWDDEMIDAIRAPLNTLILVYGFILAISALPTPTEPFDIARFVDAAGHTVILLIFAWTLLRLASVFDIAMRQKAKDPAHWLDLGIVPLIAISVKGLILITSVVVIAQNLGYSVSGLVASLGLGGAALALASKDTISNLFGSLMIMIDKPFTVGDWIRSDNFEGTVEEIGFRSTRIRTFAKTMENIPNNVLANVKVENMDRRKDPGLGVRRIKETIGITYDASAEQVERAVEAIRTILREDEGIDQRVTQLVYFTGFGDSSLDIMIYCFSNSADWAYWLNVRQRVNLKIMRALEELGLAFAFPSRSVYIESMPESIASPSTD